MGNKICGPVTPCPCSLTIRSYDDQIDALGLQIDELTDQIAGLIGDGSPAGTNSPNTPPWWVWVPFGLFGGGLGAAAVWAKMRNG